MKSIIFVHSSANEWALSREHIHKLGPSQPPPLQTLLMGMLLLKNMCMRLKCNSNLGGVPRTIEGCVLPS